MDDQALADAWESFATALAEVPARRMERWLCRPTRLADLGQSPALSAAAELNRAMAMRGMPSSTYATTSGLFGMRLF